MDDFPFAAVVREWLASVHEFAGERTVGEILDTPEGSEAWSRAWMLEGAIVGAPADPEAFG